MSGDGAELRFTSRGVLAKADSLRASLRCSVWGGLLTHQFVRVQREELWRKVDPRIFVDKHSGEVSAFQFCKLDVCASEVGPSEIRTGEVCALEIRPAEVRAGEVSLTKRCSSQFCIAEVCMCEVRPIEYHVTQLRIAEICMHES